MTLHTLIGCCRHHYFAARVPAVALGDAEWISNNHRRGRRKKARHRGDAGLRWAETEDPLTLALFPEDGGEGTG